LDSGQPASSEALSKELEEGAFFSKRAESEMLDQTVLEAMVPDLPVLRTAYLIEKDFAEYYEKSAQQVTGEGRKVLEMLAKWERGHELLFKNMHDKAYELYNQMPWGG
jgi:rubrerythrin